MKKTPLNIIFDMTSDCPFECPICCMDAKAGKKMPGELTHNQKMKVIDQLKELQKKHDVSVDFSGGEVFTDLKNLEVIEHAANIIGKEKIGISTSGLNINANIASRISKCAAEVEMTIDTIPGREYPLRPKQYAMAAKKAIPFLKKAGVKIGIQTVMAHSNLDLLPEIYDWLNNNDVDKWSLLAFYPSGRGINFAHEALSINEKGKIVNDIKSWDRQNHSEKKVELDFHYTLPGSGKSQECRCVKKSIGILPDGNVTACFWAVSLGTKIIDQKFYLGKVPEQSLKDTLNSDNAKYFSQCSRQCQLQSE